MYFKTGAGLSKITETIHALISSKTRRLTFFKLVINGNPMRTPLVSIAVRGSS